MPRWLPLLLFFWSPGPLLGQECTPPRTALVLSGGGAKGLAHVGVLRALDSLGIRPDIVVGTSMGAIVGGLYASGYSGREIDSLARGVSLTRFFRTYEPRVPSSIGLLQPAIVWEEEAGGLTFQRAAVLSAEINALLNAAFLRGNIAARGDFDSLPIPFRAVATDLLSGRPFVFSSGDLARSVRASAAIPLLFEPEQLAGRYLGDGGLSANVPIAVARAEGARRIIVSITTEQPPDSLNLQSTLVLIDHLIGNLFRQPGDSLWADDIAVRPDVEGFPSLDFSPSAIRTLVDRGMAAAMASLAGAGCLPGPPTPPRRATLPTVIGGISFAGAARADSAILYRLLRVRTGDTVHLRDLRTSVLRLGSSDRYAAVWLYPKGSGDTVRFEVTPQLGPTRVVAVGAAYDNDLGGRIWIGQVNRNFLRRNLEAASAAFLGELRQDIQVGVRLSAAIRPVLLPVVGFQASRELVRRFQGGTEGSPLKVHEAAMLAGLDFHGPRGWQSTFGLEARAWDEPGHRGKGAIGVRFEVVKAGRLAEPLVRLGAAANGEYRRVELEGIATIRLGPLRLRPRARYGAGESLPFQHQFVLGGVDGFAGLHIGEERSQRELSGSIVLLYPLAGQLFARIEPMLGATGGNDGLGPSGPLRSGVRAGLNLVTGLGPIRVEYGVSTGGRDALLVRLGRWF